MTSHQSDPILACNVQAIPNELRPVHQANTEQLMASAQEMRELETGYTFRFPNDTGLLRTIADFMGHERLCCPFFYFRLEIEPNQGPIWLSITGAVDMKPFLQSEGLVIPHS
jgi:hypothetical protein